MPARSSFRPSSSPAMAAIRARPWSRGSSHMRGSSSWSAVRRNRSSTAAEAAASKRVGGATHPTFDGGKILANFEFAKARQDELLQTCRKTIIQPFADGDNALFSIKQTTNRLQLQGDVLNAPRRAFDLSEQ